MDKNKTAYRNEQLQYQILQAKVEQAKLNSELKLITVFKQHPDYPDLIIRDLVLCHKCTDVELTKAGLSSLDKNTFPS